MQNMNIPGLVCSLNSLRAIDNMKYRINTNAMICTCTLTICISFSITTQARCVQLIHNTTNEIIHNNLSLNSSLFQIVRTITIFSYNAKFNNKHKFPSYPRVIHLRLSSLDRRRQNNKLHRLVN